MKQTHFFIATTVVVASFPQIEERLWYFLMKVCCATLNLIMMGQSYSFTTVKTMENVRGHFAAFLAFKAEKFLRMQ